MNEQTVYFPFDVDLLPVKNLRAGSLTCLYEHGNLRCIKLGDREVLRMIYTAVRDKDWATAPYTIENETIDAGEDWFLIHYTALYELNDIRYKTKVTIKGKANVISFSMHGEALSDFYRNRIGICVLHPDKECAGERVTIIHHNGDKDEAQFPVLISPHQPFKNIKQMQWQPLGASANLFFEGDVFETEDQRNWSDASFKTYSTPLEISFPVLVKRGELVKQRIRLETILNTDSEQKAARKDPQKIGKLPFPKIGYERAYASPKLLANDIHRLQQIIFDHYRVALHLADEIWRQEWTTAIEEAKDLHVPVELVVFVSSATEELTMLAKHLQKVSFVIRSILILQEEQPVTPPHLLEKAYPLFKSIFPNAKIGYGTDGFFAELNRNRPAKGLPFDFVSHSLNPQVHASDTRSLLENLEAQRHIIESAKSFAHGKELFVSPITFMMRNKHRKQQSTIDKEDYRMHTSFGAMWTLLAIKNLGGASQLCFYQAKGHRGILTEHSGAANKSLYKMLEKLKNFQPQWIIYESSNEYEVLLENARGERVKFAFSGKQ